MIGIIVLFVISWLVIWLFAKGNLSVLGLLPGKGVSKLAIFVFFYHLFLLRHRLLVENIFFH